MFALTKGLTVPPATTSVDPGASIPPSDAAEIAGVALAQSVADRFAVLREQAWKPDLAQFPAACSVLVTEEGFKVGGNNSSDFIGSLVAIGERQLSEKDRAQLISDNDYVQANGLSHKALADFLSIPEVQAESRRDDGANGFFVFNERLYCYTRLNMREMRGADGSPYDPDELVSQARYTITCLNDGRRLSYTRMLVHTVEGYGDYLDRDTDKRVDPQGIALLAGYTPSPPGDPVAALTANPGAKVELTSVEQLERLLSLRRIERNITLLPGLSIAPRSLADLYGMQALDPSFDMSQVVDQTRLQSRELVLDHNNSNFMGLLYRSEALTESGQKLLLESTDSVRFAPESGIVVRTQFLNNALRMLSDPSRGVFTAEFMSRMKLERLDVTALVNVLSTNVHLLREVSPVLERVIPGLKGDIAVLCREQGIDAKDGASLADLLMPLAADKQQQAAADRIAERLLRVGKGYEKTLEFKDARMFCSLVEKTALDGSYSGSAAEREALERMGIEPQLVPFAIKAVGKPDPEMVLHQLYNGSAARDKWLADLQSAIPADLPRDVRERVEAILDGELNRFGSKPELAADYIAQISRDRPGSSSEVDRLYLELRVPEAFKPLVLGPEGGRLFKFEIGDLANPLRLVVVPEEVNQLEKIKDLLGEKPILVVGDRTFVFDFGRITCGTESIRVSPGGSVNLP